MENLSSCHMGFIYDYKYDLDKNELNADIDKLVHNKYCDSCALRHTCGYGCHFRYSYNKSFPGSCIWHIFQQKILFEQKIKSGKSSKSFEELFKLTTNI